VVEVQRDVAVLLLDVLQRIELASEAELHADLIEQLVQLLGDFPACEIVALDCVRQGIALVDRNCVRDAVARVQNDAGGSASRVEGQYCLVGGE
jgi:hypothetical protein